MFLCEYKYKSSIYEAFSGDMRNLLQNIYAIFVLFCFFVFIFAIVIYETYM